MLSLKCSRDEEARHGEAEYDNNNPEGPLRFGVRVVHPVGEAVERGAVAVLPRVGLDDGQAAPPLPLPHLDSL